MDDLTNAIMNAQQQGIINATREFATDKSYGIHPHQGIPQLYFDQLNIIGQHLQAIKHDQNAKATIRTLYPNGSTTNPTTSHSQPLPESEPNAAQKFPLQQLCKRDDWPEWQKSRYKMLDKYREQGMFGQPMALPTGANALHMLWTYLLKICGT